MHPFSRAAFLAVMLTTMVITVGCAGVSPAYVPSIDHVESLKSSGAKPAKVGVVVVQADLPSGKAIGLRGHTMASPVGSSFGDYIADALRQELELANLYDAQSGLEISGTLLQNDIIVGAFSSSVGQIEIRFFVKQSGFLRFDKVKRIEHKWDGSLVGDVAIPRAVDNYPVMVQKLIGELVADSEFIRSLKN
jgi:hypothetical protein